MSIQRPGIDSKTIDLSANTEITPDVYFVPDGSFLMQGDFSRIGSDLVITNPAGERIVVEGYFDGNPPPNLMLSNGAGLTADTVRSLLKIDFDPTQVAGPEDAIAGDVGALKVIGTVKFSLGKIKVTGKDGVERSLKRGDKVYEGDEIVTSKSGLLKITLSDGTKFQLGKDARAVLDEFNYAPDAGQGNFSTTVLSGAFRYVSGKIAKVNPGEKHTSIKTPTATMGIRGSAIDGQVDPESGLTTVVHESGIIDISDINGLNTVTLDSPGQASVITINGPSNVFQAPPSLISQLQSSFSAGPAGAESGEEEESTGNEEGGREGGEEGGEGDGEGGEESEDSEGDAEDEGGTEEGGTEEGSAEEGGADSAGGDDAGADSAGGDEAGADSAGGDEAGADSAGGDDAGADSAGGDDAGADSTGGDEAGADSAGGDDAAADSTGGDDAGGNTGGDGPANNQQQAEPEPAAPEPDTPPPAPEPAPEPPAAPPPPPAPVQQQNAPPTANNDAATVAEDTASIDINVLGNDTDGDDDVSSLDVTLNNPSSAFGTAEVLPNGQVRFTLSEQAQALNAGQTEVVTLSYTIEDPASATDTGQISITITGSNDAPVISANTALGLNEGDSTQVISSDQLSASDVDQGTEPQDIVYVITETTQSGNLNLNNGEPVSLTVGDTFTQADINAGRVSYSHNGNETTSDGFSFRLQNSADDNSENAAILVDGESSGRFTFDIAPVNDTPEIAPPAQVALPEDGTLTLSGLTIQDPDASDATISVQLSVENGRVSFPVSDGLTITSASVNALEDDLVNGVRTISFEGSISAVNAALNAAQYLPDANFEGQDNISFQISDGEATRSSSISIDVAASNDAPIVDNNAGLTLAEGATQIINGDLLTTSDVDNSNAELVYTLTSLTNNGSLLLSTEGEPTSLSVGSTFTQADLDAGRISYTHNGSETIADSFGFTVSDGEFTIDGQTFDINVTPVNDAPQLDNNAGLTLAEGATQIINSDLLTTSDVDNSNAELVYTLTSLTSNGSLLLSTEGEPTSLSVGSTFTQADLDAGRISYTHNGSETIADSFGFTVSDGEFTIDGQTFDINVTPVNDAPQLDNNAGLTLAEGATQIINGDLLTTSDVDNSNAELVYTLTSLTNNGSLLLSTEGEPTSLSVGSTFTQADLDAGRISYTHNGSETITDSFGFTVSDGEFTIDGQTFDINVTPINDAPQVDNNDGLTLAEGATQIINSDLLTTSDVDNSNAELVYTLTSLTSNGSLLLSTDGEPTSLSVGSTFTQADLDAGRITYTHNGSETTADGFGFTVSDGEFTIDGQTFDINVTPVNDAPQVDTNVALNIDEAGFQVISRDQLASSDVDNNDAELLYTLTDLPTDGLLFLLPVAPNVAEPVPVEPIEPLPEEPFDPELVEPIVPIDDEPEPISSPPEPLAVGSTFTQADIDSGRLVYIHNGSENSTDSFGFTVSDGIDVVDGQTFNITVNPVNDAPQVDVNNALTVDEGRTTTISADQLSSSDVDSNNDALVYTVNSLPNAGRLILVIEAGVNVVTLNAGDTFTQADLNNNALLYAHDGAETPTDSFVFSVSDGEISVGGQIFNINVTPLNDPPSSGNSALVLNEGETRVLNAADLSVNDPDTAPEQLVYSLLVQPTNGFLFLNDDPEQTPITTDSDVTFTQADINNGRISYRHNGDETTSDTAQFFISDGDNLLSTSLQITIAAINDAPVLQTANNFTVLEGGEFTLTSEDLSATDDDNAPAEIRYVLNSTPNNGTVLLDGIALTAGQSFSQEDLSLELVSYRHNGNELPNDVLNLTLTDIDGNTVNIDPIQVSITPVDDAPVIATNQAIVVPENSRITIDNASLRTIDNDTDPSQIVYTLTTVPSEGTLLFFDDIIGNEPIGETSEDPLLEPIEDPLLPPPNEEPLEEPRIIGPIEITLGAGATFTQADIDAGRITYMHNGSPGTQDSFAFSVTDGNTTLDNQSFDINILQINESPAVILADEAPTFTEVEGADDRSNAVIINSNVQVIDPDGPTISQATVVIGNPSDGDELLFEDTATITAIGNGSSNLTLTAVAGTSPSNADFEAALSSVRYNNTSDTPDTQTRNVTFRVFDGNGAGSNAIIEALTVNATNDAPQIFPYFSGVADLSNEIPIGEAVPSETIGFNVENFAVAPPDPELEAPPEPEPIALSSIGIDNPGNQYAFLDSRALTVEFWLNLDELQVDETGRDSILKINGENNDFELLVDETGRLSFANNSTELVAAAGTELQLDQWHHIAASYDGAGKLNLYIDGQLVARGVDLSFGNTNTAYEPLFFDIGGSLSQRLDGQLADLRYWDTVRDQREIDTQRFDFILDEGPIPEGLIGSWPFESFDGFNLLEGPGFQTRDPGGNFTEYFIADEDVTTVIDGLQIRDVDIGDGELEAFFGVINGTLKLGDTEGLTSIFGDNSNEITIRGSLTEINEAISKLTYTSELNANGGDTLNIQVSQFDGEDFVDDFQSLEINVRPVNDAPIVESISAGQALALDAAVGQYAIAADSISLNPNSLTVEAWVRPDNLSLDPNVLQSIVMKGDANSSEGFSYHLQFAGDRLRIAVMSNDGGTLTLDSNQAFNSGDDIHVAATYEFGNLNLYINGELDNSLATENNALNDDNGPLGIGAYLTENGSLQPGDSRLFSGRIDEVRIWDFARNASQIADDFRSPIEPGDPSLVALYDMEGRDNNEAPLVDRTDNNNDAVVIGSPASVPSTAEIGIVLDNADPRVIPLGAFDIEDGSVQILTITSLPTQGQLFQFNPEFENNVGALITTTGTIVSDAENLVVYVPGNAAGTDTFSFTATDFQGAVSEPGIINVITPQTPFIPPTSLGDLNAAQGFSVFSEETNDSFGASAAGVGDVNGDGFTDLIIGASGSGTGGRAYLLPGSATGIDTNLNNAIDLSSDQSTSLTGAAVAGGVDFNNDGIDDLIIGAPAFDSNGLTNNGRAFIVNGAADLNSQILDPAQANIQAINGAVGSEQIASSVSSAGDFNGDGIDDIIIGIPQSNIVGTNSGKATIVFGSNNPGDIDLTNLTTNQGLRVDGESAGDFTGQSVASVGDVNGDGFDDILIGAPRNAAYGGPNSGSAYLLFGGHANIDPFNGVVKLSTPGSFRGVRFDGDTANSYTGYAVSSAGDFNGDGLADLAISAYGKNSLGRQDSGAVYVIFGSTGLVDDRTVNLGVVDSLPADEGIAIYGTNAYDQIGRSISSAGDFNGDGIDDLLIGAPNASRNSTPYNGTTYLIYGSRDFTGNIDLAGLTADQGFEITGTNAYDNAGASVSSAGDINGDGFDDLLIGTNPQGYEGGGYEYGSVSVIFGGDTNNNVTHLGNNGDNNLIGNSADNFLFAQAGNDSINGFGGNDLLNGGNGNDVLRGGQGDDQLIGGAGEDLADFSDAQSSVFASLGSYGAGGALNLQQGTTDRVEVANFQPNFTNGFTLEAWVTTNNPVAVFLEYTGSGENLIQLAPDHIFINNEVFNLPVNVREILADGNPHHVAFTRDNTSGNFEIYVDGDVAAQGSFQPGYIPPNGQTLIIGQDPLGPDFENSQLRSETANGNIDEVRIWNTIRSDAEINEFMNQSLQGDENGLQLYYDFDIEPGSTTIIDRSPNGADGTLIGGQIVNSEIPLNFIGNGPQDVGGGLGVDTLIDIEGLIGSNFDDVLIGNDDNNVLSGGGGNDILVGGAGFDIADYQNIQEGPGSAIDLNGTDSHLQIASNTSLDFTTNFTLEAWIKLDALNGLQTIFSKDGIGSDPNGAYNLAVLGNGALEYEVNNIASVTSTGGLIATDTWQHVAVSYDANRPAGEQVRLFVDGERVAQGDAPPPTQLDNDLLIGRRGVGDHLDGQIDEVRLWENTRSDDDILDFYRHTLTGQEEGLVGNYHFDPDSRGDVLNNSVPESSLLLSQVNTTTVDSGATLGGVHVDLTQAFRKPAALVFDGTVNNAASAPVTGISGQQITIEFWAVSSSAPEDSQGVVFSYATSGFLNAIFIRADGLISINNTEDTLAGLAFNDDQLHHVAITWDGSLAVNNLQVYQDGQFQGAVTLAAGTTLLDGGHLVIGQDQDAIGGGFEDNNAFNGLVDEVRVWNTIRSQAEIDGNRNTHLTGDEDGLVAYYDFNDPKGSNVAEDLSDNGNDLQFIGEPRSDFTPVVLDNEPQPIPQTISAAAGADFLSDIEGVTGSNQDDTIFGDVQNNLLEGKDGNDVLDGEGGADQVFGGKGDDILIYDTLDIRLDGGEGNDTLLVEGSRNVDLDGENFPIRNIETIDLASNDGDNSVFLSINSLLNSTDDNNVLTILGDSGDRVLTEDNFTQQADTVVNGQTFNTFSFGISTLLLDQDVTLENLANN